MHFNFIQYGLGDNATFVQNIISDRGEDGQHSEYSGEIEKWIEAIKVLCASRRTPLSESLDEIAGISIDAVEVFTARLERKCARLPNCSVRQYAGGREPGEIEVFGLPANLLELPSKADTQRESHLWTLRNMSSTGRPHFEVDEPQESLGKVKVVTYAELCHEFKIDSVDVLQIDTEGDDCLIIDGLIEAVNSGLTQWPGIISFETLGHADRKYGAGIEAATIAKLQAYKYFVIAHSQQTSLVHDSVIAPLRWWITATYPLDQWCVNCHKDRWHVYPPIEASFPANWVNTQDTHWAFRPQQRFICLDCWNWAKDEIEYYGYTYVPQGNWWRQEWSYYSAPDYTPPREPRRSARAWNESGSK